MSEIPLAPIKKIMKSVGAERVADEAAEAVRDILLKNARAISEKAVIMSNVAGRKTVKKEDVYNALKYFQE